MAFCFPAVSSVSSYNLNVPGKFSKTGKPNLIVRGSLSNNCEKQSVALDKDTVLKSNLVKQLKHPMGHPSVIEDIHVEHVRKLKAFKHMIGKIGEDSFEGLVIIDAVQRLGIDYHFQNEIQQILRRQYVISTSDSFQHHHCLQEISLRFRLLRQEGFNVPCDVFNRFTNEDGKFNQRVKEDINGLLDLYEASQLCVEGEDVLDEARQFSSKLLNDSLTNLDDYQAEIVRNTLLYPYHRTLARFVAKNFFLRYFQGENRWINVFQDLAKMDFSLVQSLHQSEIVQISKWWKDLALAKKLKFARDQPLKWYIWSMVCFTDANMSWQRIELTKPICFIYIIDDIFDVYGTLDELTIFTEIVKRWDHEAINQLPDYMKICFQILDNVTNEISYKVYKEQGFNPVHSLRKVWSSLCNAFLVEAKWFADGSMPKAEEYLKNGIISSGIHVVLVHVFFLLGQNVTKETVQLIDNNPGIISSTATILRLWDDLGSAEDENQGGKDGSYVYYYMREHQVFDLKAAEKHTMDKISDAWMCLNKECVSSNPFSSSFIRVSLNLARMVPLIYSYDNNQRLLSFEKFIKSFLFENEEPTQGVY
ncbi:(3S,6E)-nerolidol synthase 1-like isoform X1 [Mangifera indica]|uniref:(3S,6E)-nerolidol synthase 1-like isoform X1 n=1 Tax=Mangifera indica TaxID=29780 RepID=UPI001CF96D27|nr:(3S,6E)-nerolidol synthase 1-like isoform X1 [Mangifera indica]